MKTILNLKYRAVLFEWLYMLLLWFGYRGAFSGPIQVRLQVKLQ